MGRGHVETGRGDVAGHHQGPLPAAAGEAHGGNVERRDKGEARLVDVEGGDSRSAQAQGLLDQHRSAGNRLLHHPAGADQHIEVVFAPARFRQGLARRARGHDRGGFVLVGQASRRDPERRLCPAGLLAEQGVHAFGGAGAVRPVDAVSHDAQGRRRRRLNPTLTCSR